MGLRVWFSCELRSCACAAAWLNDCRASEILKEVRPFIEEGVGIHVIIKGLRAARDLVGTASSTQLLSLISGQAIKQIKDIAITVDKSDET